MMVQREVRQQLIHFQCEWVGKSLGFTKITWSNVRKRKFQNNEIKVTKTGMWAYVKYFGNNTTRTFEKYQDYSFTHFFTCSLFFFLDFRVKNIHQSLQVQYVYPLQVGLRASVSKHKNRYQNSIHSIWPHIL